MTAKSLDSWSGAASRGSFVCCSVATKELPEDKEDQMFDGGS